MPKKKQAGASLILLVLVGMLALVVFGCGSGLRVLYPRLEKITVTPTALSTGEMPVLASPDMTQPSPNNHRRNRDPPIINATVSGFGIK